MNKLIGNIVGITIVIILVASLLFPILEDNALKEKTTYTNTGTEYFDEVEETVITVTLGDSFAIDIDGEAVTVAAYSPIAIADSFLMNRNGATGVDFCAPASSQTITAYSGTMTVTLSDGTWTAVNGEQEATGTYTKALVKSEEASDYLKQTTGTVNKDSEIMVYVGLPVWGAKEGQTVIENVTLETLSCPLKTFNEGTVTGSVDSTLTWEAHNNGNSSYDISELANSEVSDHLYMFIPSEYYTYEETTYSNLLGALGVIIIAAILVSAVAIIRRE